MVLALVILVPLLILVAWAYFRLSPRAAAGQGVAAYNAGVFAVAAILCAGLTWRLYGGMSGGPDEAWWPVLSLLGSLVIVIVCLVVGGVVRNVLVFRPRG